METTEALKIIEALADGFDPLTGEIFPPDSPYQNPQTAKALLAAKSALERLQRNEERRRALPERAGKRWNEKENLAMMMKFTPPATDIIQTLLKGIHSHLYALQS